MAGVVSSGRQALRLRAPNELLPGRPKRRNILPAVLPQNRLAPFGFPKRRLLWCRDLKALSPGRHHE
jgi:hypothetical protein